MAHVLAKDLRDSVLEAAFKGDLSTHHVTDSKIECYRNEVLNTTRITSKKDITKIKSLEEKLKLKEKYNLKSLEKVEFEYVTLLNQSIYIMKKEKINNKEFYNKRKNGNKKYLKKAFKEAIGMQKIKLLMLVFQPNLYGKIVEHRWRF